MKKIEDGIVFSEDIKRILSGKNALDFNYNKKGLVIPNDSFIKDLRKSFRNSVDEIFNNKVTIIKEEILLNEFNELINSEINKIQIISLDKIYITCDMNSVIFLDCTRLDGTNELVSRNNTNDILDVDKQIQSISNELKNKSIKEIVLVDDVVFSGKVLRRIISKFINNGINVIGIRSSICTELSYSYFNSILKYGIKCNYLLDNNVIDQICERDFYFGIAQSGISVMNNGIVYKSPYFIPYGNPCKRASIPKQYEQLFSNSCIDRSILLWKKIAELSKKVIYIKDLPEKINSTNENEELVKVLKKGKYTK